MKSIGQVVYVWLIFGLLCTFYIDTTSSNVLYPQLESQGVATTNFAMECKPGEPLLMRAVAVVLNEKRGLRRC
jgi:hypothetical protein